MALDTTDRGRPAPPATARLAVGNAITLGIFLYKTRV